MFPNYLITSDKSFDFEIVFYSKNRIGDVYEAFSSKYLGCEINIYEIKAYKLAKDL